MSAMNVGGYAVNVISRDSDTPACRMYHGVVRRAARAAQALTRQREQDLYEGRAVSPVPEQVELEIAVYRLDSKSLWEALEAAARVGVKIQLVFQSCSFPIVMRRNANFQLRRIAWGEGSSEQMHAKFVCCSALKLKDSAVMERSVLYVTSANADDDNDEARASMQQAGFCVRGHAKLYEAHRRYFGLLWTHALDASIARFREYMYANDLNYHDNHFHAFFYPVHKSDTWQGPLNPLGFLLDTAEQATDTHPQHIELRVHVSEYRHDAFGAQFVNRLNALVTQVEALRVSEAEQKRVYDDVQVEVLIASVLGNEGDARHSFPRFRGKTVTPTHAKSYALCLPASGLFFSVAGSPSCTFTAHALQANTQLMIVEYKDSRTSSSSAGSDAESSGGGSNNSGSDAPVYDALANVMDSVH